MAIDTAWVRSARKTESLAPPDVASDLSRVATACTCSTTGGEGHPKPSDPEIDPAEKCRVLCRGSARDVEGIEAWKLVHRSNEGITHFNQTPVSAAKVSRGVHRARAFPAGRRRQAKFIRPIRTFRPLFLWNGWSGRRRDYPARAAGRSCSRLATRIKAWRSKIHLAVSR